MVRATGPGKAGCRPGPGRSHAKDATMKRFLGAGLLALPLLLASTHPASAQFPAAGFGPGCFSAGFQAYPSCGLPCAFARCGGICMNLFGKIHFHGPLFNYGPYAGYYPFEPYGPWTSTLQYNPPLPAGKCHTSSLHDRAWKLYSLLTLQNIRDRVHPLRHKCGKGGWSDCSAGSCESNCDSTPGASVVTIPPIPENALAAETR
jgi:hypothetical protein